MRNESTDCKVLTGLYAVYVEKGEAAQHDAIRADARAGGAARDGRAARGGRVSLRRAAKARESGRYLKNYNEGG